MSEYQYYEFTAVDRPLTAQQQAELRARSTRAIITATSFVNEYHWGDLKGDPKDWVKRYFDAHLYSANWGSCRLLLRLPRSAMEFETLVPFVTESVGESQAGFADAFEATGTADYWLLDWQFNGDPGDHERFWSEADGPGWMTQLLPLRDELLRGDSRPLYLGWLARLCNDELTDEDLEPPLPAGLQTLTPAQSALCEFLLINPDWLEAAAMDSAPLTQSGDNAQVEAWLAGLPPETMRATLRQILTGRGQEAERSLRHGFLAWQRAQYSPSSPQPRRRSVGEIAIHRQRARDARLERERKAQAAAEARSHQQRLAYLVNLLTNANRHWEAIDTTLQRGSGAAYDQALHSLQDLVEAYRHADRHQEFAQRLAGLMALHGNRKAWVARLTKAGILKETMA